MITFYTHLNHKRSDSRNTWYGSCDPLGGLLGFNGKGPMGALVAPGGVFGQSLSWLQSVCVPAAIKSWPTRPLQLLPRYRKFWARPKTRWPACSNGFHVGRSAHHRPCMCSTKETPLPAAEAYEMPSAQESARSHLTSPAHFGHSQ